MKIAEVSKLLDISADTLRYYERIGLIPKIHRDKSGNRDYTELNCKWIKFIKCMRNAGMPIEILIEYVTLLQEGEHTAGIRKELLLEQREHLQDKIDELQQMLLYLNGKIDKYDEVTFASPFLRIDLTIVLLGFFLNKAKYLSSLNIPYLQV